MMKEYVDSQKIILNTKLERLIEQFNSLLYDEFPVGDSNKAIEVLKTKALKIKSNLDGFNEYSPQIRLALSRHVKYVLEYSSHILGILARSATTRNSFELYEPFRAVSQCFFDDDVYLIMSSEWGYVPFTYPMNIQELPDFIIIGLPATETTNVLIFPTAAHELGHSIWLKHRLVEVFSQDIERRVLAYIAENPRFLDQILAGINGGDEEPNLFESQMRQQFVLDATDSCMRQIEELFCDFIAIGMYGKAYLYAFAYLVAPGDGGERSLHYPDTRSRAEVIEEYAKQLGFEVGNYAKEFTPDSQKIQLSYEGLLLKVADQIRSQVTEKIFQSANDILNAGGQKPPQTHNIESAINSFRFGVPTDENYSLGEILSAAWDIFIDWQKHLPDQSEPPEISYISDLVLKSVEAREFNRRMSNAERF